MEYCTSGSGGLHLVKKWNRMEEEKLNDVEYTPQVEIEFHSSFNEVLREKVIVSYNLLIGKNRKHFLKKISISNIYNRHVRTVASGCSWTRDDQVLGSIVSSIDLGKITKWYRLTYKSNNRTAYQGNW